jgi:hypothetical protein
MQIEYATANLARARADAMLRHAAGQPAAFTPPDGVDPAAASAETDAVRARISAVDQERSQTVQEFRARAAAEKAEAEAIVATRAEGVRPIQFRMGPPARRLPDPLGAGGRRRQRDLRHHHRRGHRGRIAPDHHRSLGL